jgi:hypothetical protein
MSLEDFHPKVGRRTEILRLPHRDHLSRHYRSSVTKLRASASASAPVLVLVIVLVLVLVLVLVRGDGDDLGDAADITFPVAAGADPCRNAVS